MNQARGILACNHKQSVKDIPGMKVWRGIGCVLTPRGRCCLQSRAIYQALGVSLEIKLWRGLRWIYYGSLPTL